MVTAVVTKPPLDGRPLAGPPLRLLGLTSSIYEAQTTIQTDVLQIRRMLARTLGVSLREFYRQAARERAAAVLAEHSQIVLDHDDASQFLDALDHPERFVEVWLVGCTRCRSAATFYVQRGFQPAEADGLTLMVPLEAVRAAMLGA